MNDYANAHGVGNVLCMSYHYENITEMFTAFGEKTVTSEKVAKDLGEDLPDD